MTTRSFLANFFRQGTSESSTRLVGILSFFAAVGLAFYMVIVGQDGRRRSHGPRADLRQRLHRPGAAEVPGRGRRLTVMTELALARDLEKVDCTFGTFRNAGVVECQTLEPPSAHPMPDRRRIPAGRYLARLRYSPAHGYAVYGYVNVPGFSDVEIHPGNDVLDTKACTLVGAYARHDRDRRHEYDAVLAAATRSRRS
jgi:hypothetical protein